MRVEEGIPTPFYQTPPPLPPPPDHEHRREDDQSGKGNKTSSAGEGVKKRRGAGLPEEESGDAEDDDDDDIVNFPSVDLLSLTPRASEAAFNTDYASSTIQRFVTTGQPRWPRNSVLACSEHIKSKHKDA